MHCQIGHTGVILLLAALSVFLSMLHVDSQNIDTPPQHASVEVGNSVTLACGVSGDVGGGNNLEWWEYVTSSTGRMIFTTSNGNIDDAKYEIEGTYNLKIKNAALTDGGEYGCRLAQDPEHKSADLVVISNPDPLVPTIVEGDNVTLSCEVNYGSRPLNELAPQHEPKLKAYVDGHLVNNAQESLTDNGDSYTLRLIMHYIGNPADNDKNMTCEVSTENPSYTDYGTETINVLFVVRDIVLAPRNEKYYVGEHINCTASGNPTPEYTWAAVTSNGPAGQSGSTLKMFENMIGTNTWKCRAANTVKDSVIIEEEIGPFEVVASTAEPDEGESNESVDAGIIAVAVIVPLVVIAAIAIGVFFWWKRKQSQTDQDTSPKQKGEVNPDFNEEKPPINFDLTLDPAYSQIGAGIPPQKTGRDSPGYGDLGIKQIHPAVNLGASFDDSSFEDREVNHQPPPYDNKPDTAV